MLSSTTLIEDRRSSKTMWKFCLIPLTLTLHMAPLTCKHKHLVFSLLHILVWMTQTHLIGILKTEDIDAVQVMNLFIDYNTGFIKAQFSIPLTFALGSKFQNQVNGFLKNISRQIPAAIYSRIHRQFHVCCISNIKYKTVLHHLEATKTWKLTYPFPWWMEVSDILHTSFRRLENKTPKLTSVIKTTTTPCIKKVWRLTYRWKWRRWDSFSILLEKQQHWSKLNHMYSKKEFA